MVTLKAKTDFQIGKLIKLKGDALTVSDTMAKDLLKWGYVEKVDTSAKAKKNK